MIKTIRIIGIMIVLGIYAGCSHDHEDDVNTHEHAGISITQYTDATEIFMEYPPLVINRGS